MQENELTPQRYMSWPVLSLLVFITVIGFENIFYPFQNQGLSVVINWVILLIVYIVPYALIAAQLGTTFTRADEGGGLATWMRRTLGDTWGYWTSWIYWAQTLPYLVDVSNAVIVALSWMILGDNSLGKRMSNLTFGLLTFAIILLFIVLENLFSRSLEVMSLIGGAAMFLMAVLFVALTAAGLARGCPQPRTLAGTHFDPTFHCIILRQPGC